MKHPLFWVLLGLLVPGAQALGATTGPLVVQDLTSPTVTANANSNSAQTAKNDAASKSDSSGVSAAGGQKTGSAGLMVLVQKLQSYQQQLDEMRGQIEVLQHRIKQMQSSAKDRYMDLDTRINELAKQSESTPDKESHSRSPTDAKADKKAYLAARNSLLDGDHQAAAKALQGYIKDYPDGAYIAKAHFWLGEVYRIEGNKASREKAIKQFNIIINDYPDSSRVPTALYKLAVVKAKEGKVNQSKVPLKRILKQFPDSSEAKLAKKMLKAF